MGGREVLAVRPEHLVGMNVDECLKGGDCRSNGWGVRTASGQGRWEIRWGLAGGVGQGERQRETDSQTSIKSQGYGRVSAQGFRRTKVAIRDAGGSREARKAHGVGASDDMEVTSGLDEHAGENWREGFSPP
eukprot:751720-Hanusia_phi.AAC.2